MSVCQSCGACCAAFRVDFHPVELAGGAFAWHDGVPVALTAFVTKNIVRMCGTDKNGPRCIALRGEIGQQVACSIYESRPSPCREFDIEHTACAQARQLHGLPPLCTSAVER